MPAVPGALITDDAKDDTINALAKGRRYAGEKNIACLARCSVRRDHRTRSIASSRRHHAACAAGVTAL
jgi:hypothetical protein